MNVFLCYSKYFYDDGPTVEKVFADEEKAKEWVANCKQKSYRFYYQRYKVEQ